MRSNPTPWAPWRTAASISSGRSTFPISRIGPSAGGDRGLLDDAFELELELVPAADLGLGVLQLAARGIEHDGAGLAVEENHRARGDLGERARGSHHRGNAEGVRQDRRVRRPGALLAHQPYHVFPVELHREAR